MRAISRALGLSSGVAVLAIGALLPVQPAATAADPVPTTATFTTPGQHAWTVPDGVTRVDVVAIGGEGAFSAIREGGRAAKIRGTLTVTPGQVLYAVVGSSASSMTPGSNGGGAAGPGPCSGFPGAGGGASDVRTIPLGEDGSAESRVVVAGGGGGAGSRGSQDVSDSLYTETYGGNRGLGGGTTVLGGFGGVSPTDPGPGGGGQGGETNGTATDGGRGGVGAPSAGQGCGGGGGGGWGGGGGGKASANTNSGGGGGGGGSLVPGGFPAGLAQRGEDPRVTFSVPGLPEPAGPLAVSLFQTFKQNDQGNGPMPWTNCPNTCVWLDGSMSTRAPGTRGGDLGYTSTQRWSLGSLEYGDFTQAFASLRPAPAGSPAALGTPFLMTNFAHYNAPIRAESPTELAFQTLLTIQAPGSAPAVFEMRGPASPHLTFTETQNTVACDPDIQVTTTPCDDRWVLEAKKVTTQASGVTWHFELLGWRKSDGTFSHVLVTEEEFVTQRDVYGRVTIDTNSTTSDLSFDPEGPSLSLDVTPIPQTGGTADFTDGGEAIAGCTDVPVDTTTGVATCTPASLSPGAHSFGGDFDGSFGYGASQAAELPYTNVVSQTVDFPAPTGITYGDGDVALGATASSGLPITYATSTPGVCTPTETGINVVAAGICSMTANQVGNDTYAPATVGRTFDIAKATLTVTADPKSRPVGAANPTLTATTTGFVNGDTAAVIAGTPSLSTTAAAASPPGTYPIDVSVASMSAANYDFVAVPGTLTVTAADAFAACEPGAPVPAGYRLLQGGPGNNVILGTAKKDLIRAGAGNDIVTALAEADIVCGGPGNDYLDGGGGTDLIDGGTGIDVLVGGAGIDRGRDADPFTFRFNVEQFN